MNNTPSYMLPESEIEHTQVLIEYGTTLGWILSIRDNYDILHDDWNLLISNWIDRNWSWLQRCELSVERILEDQITVSFPGGRCWGMRDEEVPGFRKKICG